MLRRFSLPSRRGIGIFILIVAGMLVANATGLPVALDRQFADLRFDLDDRQPTGNIVLVDIDARSLAEIGVWPWPRHLYGDLLKVAAKAGAKQVALDIDFSTRSTPAEDAAFASALSGAGLDTFLAAFVQNDTSANSKIRVSMPIASLLEASWPAAVNVVADPEGDVVSLPAAIDTGNETLMSMPALLANRDPRAGHSAIDYAIAAERIPHVSFVDLLKGRIDPQRIADKTLIVGASAVELHDLFPVPVYGTVSGSTILALATETLLQHREIRRYTPPWPLVTGLVLVLIFSLRSARASHLLAAVTLLSIGIEFVAYLLQSREALALATGQIHLLLAAATVWSFLREFDLRRLRLWMARTQVDNSRKILERVIEDAFDAVVIIDADLRIVRSNPQARALLDLAPMDSRTWLSGLPLEMADDIRSALQSFRQGQARPHALRQASLATSPEQRIVEYSVAPFWITDLEEHDEKEHASSYACLTVRDVTERQEAAERIRFMALHDALTGLGNRHSLEERLETALSTPASSDGMALIAFDLDRFKTVNDSLGHGVGDRILIETAHRANACFEDAACISRLGGDEYAVLLLSHDLETVSRKAEHFLQTLGQPFFISGHRITIGTSIGIAWWRGEEGHGSSTILRHADVALYRAKHSSVEKVVVFEPAMDDDRLARLEIERDLADALVKNQFHVVYQPQIHLRTGQPTGAEALLRWQHPKKGFISPAKFVPVAEEMGLIHELGSFVLQTACREAAGWSLPIKLAVNVSALQFETGDVTEAVRTALERSNLPPERLELEITESAFVRENDRLSRIFDDLTGLGVTFSLDDFGTGYSSLGYLHRFPISKIKIDRSFVTDVPRSGHSMAVLRSIRALAEGLDIRTIAEGIETEEQAEVLRILGCNDGQGYLFSKPINAADMRRWLVSHGSAGDPVELKASA